MPRGKPKGLPKTGGRKTGTKNKATLRVEELRQQFHDKVSHQWDLLIAAQLRDSKKNYKARQYTIDQAIGRPKETIDLGGEVSINIDV